MDNFENELLEWTIVHVKNKDILKKEIKDYKVIKKFIEFEYKDRKHIYHIHPELNEGVFEKAKEGFSTVVCLNRKTNLDFVTGTWEKLTSNPKFSIIFVNPKHNERWVVFPHTHDKITEKASLKLGLKTLFEGVPQV